MTKSWFALALCLAMILMACGRPMAASSSAAEANVSVPSADIPPQAQITPVTKILLIGDSLTCGPFGASFFSNLTAQGYDVSLFCAVSSAPTHWLTGQAPAGQHCFTREHKTGTLHDCGLETKLPTLAKLLADHAGSHVVIALGTNSLGLAAVNSSYLQMVHAIAATGEECDWIGPPHLNPAQNHGGFPNILQMEANIPAFYASLKTALQPSCTLIDSRKATAPGTQGNQTVDGIHRTTAAGVYWADQIMITD